MRQICVLIIRTYQWTISPFFGSCCRFYPSCSEYAVEAFRRHGVFSGFWLSLKRLVKCGPWHGGGIDEVP